MLLSVKQLYLFLKKSLSWESSDFWDVKPSFVHVFYKFAAKLNVKDPKTWI